MATNPTNVDTLQQVLLAELELRENVRTRFDEESLKGLAASIRESGVLVRREETKLVVTDGERRVRASRLVGRTSIPAHITGQPLDEAGRRAEQLVTNCQREGLSPVETARALAELKTAMNGTAAQVAAKVGFSASKVSRLLALLEFPEEIRDRVESGQLPLTAAAELVRLADTERAAVLAAPAGTPTRDGLAGRRKRRELAGDEEPKANATRATAVLGEGRSITVSAPDLDLEGLISLCQELLEKARRARPQGIALATFLRILKDTSNAGPSP